MTKTSFYRYKIIAQQKMNKCQCVAQNQFFRRQSSTVSKLYFLITTTSTPVFRAKKQNVCELCNSIFNNRFCDEADYFINLRLVKRVVELPLNMPKL